VTAAPLRYVSRHWADPLYRQSYLMLASTAASAGTGLLFWVVAARRADPRVVGVAAGLVAAIAFLSYLTSFALPYALLRFGGSARPVSAMTNASLLFSALTSLLAAGAFAVVAPVTSSALVPLLRTPEDVALFGLAGVGAGAAVLLDNLLAARQRAGTVLARNAAAGLLRLLLLAFAAPDDPRALYLAASLPPLVTVLGVLAVLPRLVAGYRLRELRVDAQVREAAGYALRAYPGSLLSGAPQFTLPLLAVSLLSPGENAYFYVAWSIAQIAHLVPAVISNITLSQGSDAPQAGLVGRSLRFSVILLVPACVLGIGLAEFVLGFYGDAYVEGAATPLRLLTAAVLPWAVVVIVQAQLRIEHRFTAVTALTGGLCATSLGLAVGLAPAFGVTGMAAGWLLSLLAAALLAWRLATRGTAHPVQPAGPAGPARAPVGTVRPVTAPPAPYPEPARRPLAFAALAALCAAAVAVGSLAPPQGRAGTAVAAARVVAGLVLCCYLPGRLAVGLLLPRLGGAAHGGAAHGAEAGSGRAGSGDGILGATLTLALSLVATMLVGLGITATGHRPDALGVAAGQLGACVLLAAAWYARARRGGRAGRPSVPAPGGGPPAGGVPVRHVSVRQWLAAAPAVLLTALLLAQVAGAARDRTPESYFTELAVERTGNDPPLVVVHSHEREPTDFRVEQRVAGRPVAAAAFWLRPEERAEFVVAASPAGHIEVRLYRSDQAAVYRRVTLGRA
jgi:O-antigen/teichoic acid export membrane protein